MRLKFDDAAPPVRGMLISVGVSTSRPVKSVRSLRIFVVEDDELSLSWLLLYLEANGHVADFAKTRADALILYAKDRHHLLKGGPLFELDAVLAEASREVAPQPELLASSMAAL